MIYLTTGNPSQGMSYVCTPLARTPETAGPSVVEVRPGGCIQNQNPLGHTNRDKKGLRMVKKGCKVDYYGIAFVVQRVRMGVAYGQTLMQKQYFFAPTNSVKVMD